MIVKTRNYRLERPLYIKMALSNVLLQQWWTIPIAAGICLLYFWIPSFWWITGGVLAYGLYVLFWLVQFYGVTQLDQGKMLFERFSYEITSQQIVMKISSREGMPMKWDQIKRVKAGKDYYLLFVNKAQVIHLPFKIFNSDNERKFLASILRTKGLIK